MQDITSVDASELGDRPRGQPRRKASTRVSELLRDQASGFGRLRSWNKTSNASAPKGNRIFRNSAPHLQSVDVLFPSEGFAVDIRIVFKQPIPIQKGAIKKPKRPPDLPASIRH